MATVAALAEADPDERSLVLSRAGFAGVQRLAAVWTGDNASYWEHLAMSLPQLLNLGLSGVAFAGAGIGAPVLRPLLYHHGDDPRARLCQDQALLGQDLLVAPVLQPGRDGRSVYLPAGLWYPLAGGTALPGPRRVLADAPLDGDAPAYVRGGAVLPSGPALQWTVQRPLDPLTVSVYPDQRGHACGRHYEDDGHTTAYQSGAAATTTFTYRDGVLSADRQGGYSPAPRAARVLLHGPAGVTEHWIDRDERHWRLGGENGRPDKP